MMLNSKIARIARLLAAMKLLDETGPNAYKLGKLGGIYVDGSPLIDAVIHLSVLLTLRMFLLYQSANNIIEEDIMKQL